MHPDAERYTNLLLERYAPRFEKDDHVSQPTALLCHASECAERCWAAWQGKSFVKQPPAERRHTAVLNLMIPFIRSGLHSGVVTNRVQAALGIEAVFADLDATDDSKVH